MGHSRSRWSKHASVRQRHEEVKVICRRFKNTQNRAKNRSLERSHLHTIATTTATTLDSEFQDSICFNRATSTHARELGYTVNELTSGRGLDYQRAVLHKLMKQPVLQEALPEYIVNRKELEQCRVVCNGLAGAWSGLKYGVGKDRYVARNVIEAAVISVGDERCLEAAAKCIGMNRRTLRRAIARREKLNEGTHDEVWAKINRNKRKDALPKSVVDVIVSWWTEETRVSPCKKDVRKKRIAFKCTISHATHWLEESELDFYSRFKASNEQLKVSYATFKRLKPYFVKRLRDFNSCCCKYHQEMAEITIGFNNMRARQFHLGVDGETCLCGCENLCCNPVSGGAIVGTVTCQSPFHTYKRNTMLWEKSLCPRPKGSEWHDLNCILGRCRVCGFHLIPVCERELDPTNDKLLSWRKFEMVIAGKTKAGLDKKVVRLEFKSTPPRVFLDFAAITIPQFVIHQHNARWQDVQFKACLASLEDGEVMSLIDFAENYSFKGQDEIQSQHWYNFQLTILVHITYVVNRHFDASVPTSKRLLTSYHFYISDDKVHDSLFVQHCLNIHWASLNAAGNFPSRHIVWSDGCAAQFKCSTAWFYVSRYPSLTVCDALPRGCQMDWHFWGTGYGKGPHDGAGACLKQSIEKEQVKPSSQRLHNASDVVEYLTVALNLPHAAYPGAKLDVDRHFHLIGKYDLKRSNPMACATIPGSRKMHSIRSVSHTTNVMLECRDYSCFCDVCVCGVAGSCHNSSYVAPWKLVTLRPISIAEVLQETEDLDGGWTADSDSHDLASELEVGDHFAIIADPNDPGSRGHEFFVLKCTKSMFVVEEETLKDAWGGRTNMTDEVVGGLYYEQQGLSGNSYVFLESAGVAHIYSHLVIATRFSMKLAKHKQKGGTAIYQLSRDAMNKIQSVIRSKKQVEELDSEDEEDSDIELVVSQSDYSSDSDS